MPDRKPALRVFTDITGLDITGLEITGLDITGLDITGLRLRGPPDETVVGGRRSRAETVLGCIRGTLTSLEAVSCQPWKMTEPDRKAGTPPSGQSVPYSARDPVRRLPGLTNREEKPCPRRKTSRKRLRCRTPRGSRARSGVTAALQRDGRALSLSRRRTSSTSTATSRPTNGSSAGFSSVPWRSILEISRRWSAWVSST